MPPVGAALGRDCRGIVPPIARMARSYTSSRAWRAPTPHRAHGALLHFIARMARSYSKNIAMILAPASTKVVSPVIPLARSEHRKAAALPISSIVTVRFSGADFSA